MRETVEEYYGKVLTSSSDLKTNACTTSCAPSSDIKALLKNIHDEVSSRYYGCGLVYPPLLEGLRILDLGCGSGQDCYVLAQMVGERGEVVGVDMTDEQLDVARRHVNWHTQAFGYSRPNVRFLKGYIEKLDQLDLEPGSFDVIVSNCVINLSIDKAAVLREAAKLLREGGEMYFSDVYADRRVPQHLVNDPVLYGECLSGAMYWNDFHNLAREVGFKDPRLVESSPLTINAEDVRQKIGHIGFYSATYRLFKLAGLEPACEDYGQAVAYRGTVPGHAARLALDEHHVMEKGKLFPVCGNTWRMLKDTRFADHFDFHGSWDTHYGIFEGCGTALPFSGTPAPDSSAGGSCC